MYQFLDNRGLDFLNLPQKSLQRWTIHILSGDARVGESLFDLTKRADHLLYSHELPKTLLLIFDRLKNADF